MARGIWKGSLGFGLVTIGVELYGAESPERFDLDLLDKRDMSQVEVADETGEARSQVSLLLNGKLRGFSTDRLARILLRLGRDIEIVIRPSRSGRKVGMVRLARR